jgi:hypothetical protein
MWYSSFPAACHVASVRCEGDRESRLACDISQLTFFLNLAPKPRHSPISRSLSSDDFNFPASRTSSKRNVNSMTIFCTTSCLSQNLNGTTSSSIMAVTAEKAKETSWLEESMAAHLTCGSSCWRPQSYTSAAHRIEMGLAGFSEMSWM